MKGCLAAILLGLSPLPAADLTASAGPPVVAELMGGCSLTCAFPWTAESSKTALSALNDADPTTAWTGIRAGDRLVFRFPADLPRELDRTPFYGIDFANGKTQPAGEFTDHGRITRVRLLHNGKAVHHIRLGETRRWQHVAFDDIFLDVGDHIVLEILEIAPGKKHATAALTEIVLQGAH